MSIDIIGWLVGAIGALVAVFAVKSRNETIKKAKDAEARVNSIKKAKETHETIQTLDDDRVISEFNRLYNDRRR